MFFFCILLCLAEFKNKNKSEKIREFLENRSVIKGLVSIDPCEDYYIVGLHNNSIYIFTNEIRTVKYYFSTPNKKFDIKKMS